MPSKLIKLGNVTLVRGDMSGESKEVRRYHNGTYLGQKREAKSTKTVGIKRTHLPCLFGED